MKKHFPVYIHETCLDFEFIFVSAGLRGLQIQVSPQDFLHETKAGTALLVME